MSKRVTKGRGLFYTRDSGGQHETTPGEYVDWARRRANDLGVRLLCAPEQIIAMIKEQRSDDGDLFLDYGVSGNKLSRPGLDQLFKRALTDREVSHIFIPRRDRFARPDDPIDAMKMESTLRKAGLTLVFMDTVAPPLTKGKREIADAITTMIEYDRAGNERRDLAQKMIYAQLKLAKGGYSTGGRPPFGFRRWLIGPDDKPVRELAEGEIIRMAGHHVVWLPGPERELMLIRRIVTMLETTPAARVARQLTREGISTPDSRRWRTDRGFKHQTSGVWHQTTIVNVARNPLLRLVVEYGRRSMGDRLRFTPTGPRDLEDEDRRSHDKIKVIINPPEQRIQAPARFEAPVPADQLERTLTQLDQRSQSQRGKPRSTDPTRNPLGCRIFDLHCGWPMYRQPDRQSYRYCCGLYQQSHGAECGHHHIDGPTATRFMLGCLRQRILSAGLRSRLEQKLHDLARRDHAPATAASELAARQASLMEIRQQRQQAEKNLALATTPAIFDAVSTVFEKLRLQEHELEREVQRLQAVARPASSPTNDVQAAMAVFDKMAELADATDLTTVSTLFHRLNARLFLRFIRVRKGKREVNQLSSGAVTFGASPPPIPLYEGPTGRRQISNQGLTQEKTGQTTEITITSGTVPDAEGDSLGNVNRGDRI